MGISQAQFARHLGWTYAKLNEIIHEKRGITPDTAIDLSMALGTTPMFWLNFTICTMICGKLSNIEIHRTISNGRINSVLYLFQGHTDLLEYPM